MIWTVISSGVVLLIVLWSVLRCSRNGLDITVPSLGKPFFDTLHEMDLGDLVSSVGESIGDIGSSNSDGGS